MRQIQNEESMLITARTGYSDAATAIGGSVGVVDAHVDSAIGGIDETCILRRVAIDVLDEAIGRILSLFDVSQC